MIERETRYADGRVVTNSANTTIAATTAKSSFFTMRHLRRFHVYGVRRCEGKGTCPPQQCVGSAAGVHVRPVPFELTAADLERGLARLKSVAEAAAAVETYRVARSTTIEAPPDAVQRVFRLTLVDRRRYLVLFTHRKLA